MIELKLSSLVSLDVSVTVITKSINATGEYT